MIVLSDSICLTFKLLLESRNEVIAKAKVIILAQLQSLPIIHMRGTLSPNDDTTERI